MQKTKGKKITAHEVLSPGFVDNIVKQDDGFRVLRNLRGSPPYWEKAKKDVFAMIRQLGIPTWFCYFFCSRDNVVSSIRLFVKVCSW